MAKKSYRNLVVVVIVACVVGTVFLIAGIFLRPAAAPVSNADSEAGAFAPYAFADAPVLEHSARQEVSPQNTKLRATESGVGRLKPRATEDISAARTDARRSDPTGFEPEPRAPGESSDAAVPVAQNRASAERSLAEEDTPGSIRPEDIQRVLEEQFKPVAKSCYEKVIAQFPDAEIDGRVVLAFDVISAGGEGRVELAELGEESTLFDDELHDCMLSQLGDVVFPSANGKLRVNYPFNFATDDTAADE